MRLTDEQRRAVEEYAGYAHALAFSRRVELQHADRLELRQALCLALARIVQARPPEWWHAAIIHGLRRARRFWLTDPRRLRRARAVLVHWSEAEGGRLPPVAPPDGLDDREEFRVLVLDRLDRLTPRQRQAVELYLDCGNWTEAGRLAGLRDRQSVQRLKARAVERLRAAAVAPRPPCFNA